MRFMAGLIRDMNSVNFNSPGTVWRISGGCFTDFRRLPEILHAPSHLPSPPIDSFTMVLLCVGDCLS